MYSINKDNWKLRVW